VRRDRLDRNHTELQQQVEDLKRTLPVLGLRILEIGIDDLEGARKRYAQSARDGGKLRRGLLAVVEVERGPRGEMIQNRLQLDIFIEFSEHVDVLLQPLW
jgi:hypothetical protein